MEEVGNFHEVESTGGSIKVGKGGGQINFSDFINSDLCFRLRSYDN